MQLVGFAWDTSNLISLIRLTTRGTKRMVYIPKDGIGANCQLMVSALRTTSTDTERKTTYPIRSSLRPPAALTDITKLYNGSKLT